MALLDDVNQAYEAEVKKKGIWIPTQFDEYGIPVDDVIVDGKKIEEVDRYVYLGQMVTKDLNQVQEMKKKNQTGMECIL